MSRHLLPFLAFSLICGYSLAGEPSTEKTAPATSTNPTPKVPTSPPSIQAKPIAPVRDDYVVGSGDVLEITVWKEEGFPKQTLVRPDGGITFPLVGDFQAGGLTVDQIIDGLTERLSRYFSEPAVNVAVLNSNQKIYVLGKVTKPGEQIMPNRIDVMQALAMAGGLSPFADEDDITIIRRDNNKSVYFHFDYGDVSKGESLEQNILLQRGDVVVVH